MTRQNLAHMVLLTTLSATGCMKGLSNGASSILARETQSQTGTTSAAASTSPASATTASDDTELGNNSVSPLLSTTGLASTASGIGSTTTDATNSTTAGTTTTLGTGTTGTTGVAGTTGGTGGDANSALSQRAGGSVVNPFEGAVMYVNADYTAFAEASKTNLAAAKATDAAAVGLGIDKVKVQPTAVWLDRVDAVLGGTKNGGRLGLAGHLAAAQAQGAAAGKPGVALIVVYDLPNRDCAALASNGELHDAAGLADYKSKYIDGIAAIVSQYPAVRVAIVLEPDSLPNLVTNLNLTACADVDKKGYYVQGTRYALSKLGGLPNTFIYLDIGHAGWLGWPDNMSKAVSLFMKVIKGEAIASMETPVTDVNNLANVRGFVTAVSNYTPVKEPFVSPSNQALLSGPFYSYNRMFDEVSYIAALADAFKAAGFASPAFLTDSSRSGWKPVNDGKPIDKRRHRGNWCNVTGAGIGERPQAKPAVSALLDAFVWVKPPGESDGATPPAGFDPSNNPPDAEGKRFDLSCKPGASIPLNDGAITDAMSGAPTAGHWFDEQFYALVRNAYPAL